MSRSAQPGLETGDPISALDLRPLLDAGLDRLGQDLNAEARARLIAFVRLLDRWNRVYNLTAIRDPREMIPRHLLDSLSLRPFLDGRRILDLGTGAGLPGIPLAIAEPDWELHLLDSKGKKIRFLRQAALELGLSNVTAVQARMESYLPPEKFATIVARALAAPAEIVRLAHPLLAHPGRLLIMAGRKRAARLEALDPRPHALLEHPLEVPFLDGDRHLIELCYH